MLCSNMKILRCRLPLQSGTCFVSIRSNSSTSSISYSASAASSIHPNYPVRTRFAPSPTGYLHLGSLRTALYNYLLAKNTDGTFILRLEDTDQKRLVLGAEQNIYDSLKWCGIEIDEGPNVRKEGDSGPYRQSDRKSIYQKYVALLLEAGKAYKCYCSKDRLDGLRASAMKLKPPTTVTYDRHCLNHPPSSSDSSDFVVRFKSPEKYPPFVDLTHGELNLQPQVNQHDRRYDDFVIMKSDGLPTYHFANVVDDHLMNITHVIRGEEWITSTPKHIALYEAFGWTPPHFIHIPLLTSKNDKKLSKRSGDIGVLLMRDNQGILPEALTNFVALFGWSPPRLTPGVSTTEVMTLNELIESFSLDHLTKGNAKVTEDKLKFFNKSHLQKKLQDPEQFQQIVEQLYPKIHKLYPKITLEYVSCCLEKAGPSLTTVNDLESLHSYLFKDEINYSEVNNKKLDLYKTKTILKEFLTNFESKPLAETIQLIDFPQKDIFMSLRYALAGGKSGLTIPVLIELLGSENVIRRCNKALQQ